MTRTRGGAAELRFDAYFADEDGMPYPAGAKAGAFLNAHTRIFVRSGTREDEVSHAEAVTRGLDPANPGSFGRLESGTIVKDLDNPLDASVNPGIRLPEAIPASARGHRAPCTAYAPAELRRQVREILDAGRQCPRPVQVVLLFGTGSELGRHGLRAFIDRSHWRMVINVPGVEPGYPWAAGHRWGIGITADQVGQLVRACFGRQVDFVVDRLIGFSTGYLGVTATIRNELVDLRQVRLLAFFDCNYGEVGVKSAIAQLRRAAAGRARVVAYATSAAGTPKAATRTLDIDVDRSGAVWLFGRPDFLLLTHARIIAGGLHDKTLDEGQIDASVRPRILAFLNALPKRGTVVSEPALHQLVHGRAPAAGTITLAAWYAANKAEADRFGRALWHRTGSSPELIRLLWKHQVPGWGGGVADTVVDRVAVGVFTEGVHDFMPLEFAWEVLT